MLYTPDTCTSTIKLKYQLFNRNFYMSLGLHDKKHVTTLQYSNSTSLHRDGEYFSL